LTTTLPPFSGDRPTCAKCSNTGARTSWSHEWLRCSAPKPGWYPGEPIGERLCRTCERCGFHWDEAIAAAQPVVWSAFEANLWLEDAERILAAQGFSVRLGPPGRLTAVKFETVKEQQ
jgi:hypothetical protein